MKILIAEDDNSLRMLLGLALGDRGYTVEAAANGREALEKAVAAPPDLIVSDIMMPEMDGFMLCRKIKADLRLRDIPVILYTATQSEKRESVLAHNLGASRLVVKTGGLGPLLDAVKEEIENFGAARERRPGAAGGAEEVDAEYLRVFARKLQVKEDELKRERDMAKLYLDIAGVMIVALDLAGRITMINKKGCALLGYAEGELLGKNWFDTCLPPEIRAEVAGVFKKLLSGDVSLVEYHENQVATKSGERRVIAFHNSIIHGPSFGVTGILFSGSDITDQRLAEAALLQAQKMDSIGQFSAGIAHDLNNLLGPLLAYADFLRKSLPAGDARHVDIDEITKAASRAAALVRQLLAFSRRQVLEPKVLDLNGIVKGLGGMLQRIIGERIRVVYSLDPFAGAVRVDPVQMEQVLMNLAVNARDAMEQGGTITISTGEAELERSGDRPAGRYFRLSVKDTGCGMDVPTMVRIFEPFFSTKPRDQGMGLGLSTVYGIVKQSGGEIKVESSPGEGALFTIYLPLANKEAVSAEERTGSQEKGMVLIAEDDDTMRRIARRILRGAGYGVTEAINGKDALRLIEENPRGISALLTDVVMPELDGVGLAMEVLAKYPHIRILCMSGYSDKREDLGRLLGAKAGYIQKPFSPDELVKKMEETFGAS